VTCPGCNLEIFPEQQHVYCWDCLKKAEETILSLKAYIKKLEWRLGYVGL
jgi:hypothetical protein